MFREFAVEPEAIVNFETPAYWWNAFLNDSGRFISWDEREWSRKFLLSINAAQLGQIEQKRLETLGKRIIERALVPRLISASPEIGWLRRAITEHSKAPFDAILTSEEGEHKDFPILYLSQIGEVIDVDVLPPYDVRRIWLLRGPSRFPRTSEGIRAILAVLLRKERKLLFCDPYFDMEDGTKYIRPFRGIFQEMKKAKLDPRYRVVEIHSTEHNKIAPKVWQQSIQNKMEPIIPSGQEVRFVLWKAKTHHNRYLLGNSTGITIGEGFAETSTQGREFDRAALMTFKDSEEEMENYDTKNRPNEILADFNITGR
ncbi:MAG: hypothetical protein KDA65_03580 [Planctomycetaceae bacterium]|nr:hypothetical protein [Planctomycetaceae bacterium]